MHIVIKSNEVLMSFDGSNPQCIKSLHKSIRNLSEDKEHESHRSKSRWRAHPKVNLPFYRNIRSKKKISSKNLPIKRNESINEGSTQETESKKKISENHQSFQQEITASLNGKLNKNESLNQFLPSSKFIFNTNIDFLDENGRKSQNIKRNLMRNFNASNVSPQHSEKKIQEIPTQEYIDSMKKNVKKFLLPQSTFGNEKFWVNRMLNPERSHSNPPQSPSFWNQRNENYPKKSKFDLRNINEKLRINTRLLERKDDDFEINFPKERHNYSVACSPTFDLKLGKNEIESTTINPNRTLESREPDVNSDKFKLPQLSTRNKKRIKYFTKSGRKKLPEWFWITKN